MLREISNDDRYLDMIKNLTKKDKEEGVSMCELLDRYWNGGVEEGILLNLVELVRDGLLAMDEAVKRSKLTEEEFRKLL